MVFLSTLKDMQVLESQIVRKFTTLIGFSGKHKQTPGGNYISSLLRRTQHAQQIFRDRRPFSLKCDPRSSLDPRNQGISINLSPDHQVFDALGSPID